MAVVGGDVSRSDRSLSRRPHSDAEEARAALEEALLQALSACDAQRVSELRERLGGAVRVADHREKFRFLFSTPLLRGASGRRFTTSSFGKGVSFSGPGSRKARAVRGFSPAGSPVAIVAQIAIDETPTGE